MKHIYACCPIFAILFLSGRSSNPPRSEPSCSSLPNVIYGGEELLTLATSFPASFYLFIPFFVLFYIVFKRDVKQSSLHSRQPQPFLFLAKIYNNDEEDDDDNSRESVDGIHINGWGTSSRHRMISRAMRQNGQSGVLGSRRTQEIM